MIELNTHANEVTKEVEKMKRVLQFELQANYSARIKSFQKETVNIIVYGMLGGSSLLFCMILCR
jgi:hypothetical protein